MYGQHPRSANRRSQSPVGRGRGRSANGRLTPMKILSIAFLALALCAGDLAAQARFVSYGSPCPASSSPLRIAGLPRLGSSFAVGGVLFPGRCTRKYCGCSCCDCNLCNGSILVLGVGRVKLQLPGTTCYLLAAPNVVTVGDLRGDVVVKVPNDPGLMGGRFTMQRIDLSLREVTGTRCSTTYRPLGITGTSQGVEGVVGR